MAADVLSFVVEHKYWFIAVSPIVIIVVVFKILG